MPNRDQTELIPIGAVRNAPHVQAGGKPLHPSTPARWALYGVNGIRLESRKIAGRRYTTLAALERFLERCAAVSSSCPQSLTSH